MTAQASGGAASRRSRDEYGFERSSGAAARLVCGRVWFVASVNGQSERLERAMDALAPRLLPDDAVVFAGNLIGHGSGGARSVDVALALRRFRMAARPQRAVDVLFLRGAQEEMLRKALQLQFAPEPARVLAWMIENGLEASLASYGAPSADAVAAAADGPVALARWANAVRDRIRSAPGHEHYYSALRPAAATAGGLLFVHAGLAPERAFAAQGDAFWWGPSMDLDQAFEDFALVVRGRDPSRPGVRVGAFSAAVDDGCGFGGALLVACFDPRGRVVDVVEG